MNIIARGQAFLQSLFQLANRSAWDWRRCPHCGETETQKYGYYRRKPWFFEGRQVVMVQRHRCNRCRRTYSEQSAWLVRHSWYAREVHRLSVDHWQHVGSSLRRTAEHVRSWLGKQERWQLWRPLERRSTEAEECHLSASTVHRWLDKAGREAKRTVKGQLSMVETSGQLGTDGLWARLHDKSKRVVLVLVDHVSGIVWPPVVVKGEESAKAWKRLFIRARRAGLDLEALRGVTSDGAIGLMGYLNSKLEWVNRQACVWHIWHDLRGEIAAIVNEVTEGLAGKEAKAARKAVQKEIVGLVRAVIDAQSETDAMAALAILRAHPLGENLAKEIRKRFDSLFIYLKKYNKGLVRVAPEWLWRDFRLRLGHGRNHGSDERLERAVLVWGVYRNFTPAQRRSERKRKYRHPGMSPLEVAGHPPQNVSYLDALAV